MSSGTSPIASGRDPRELWHELLKPKIAASRKFTEQFYEKLR